MLTHLARAASLLVAVPALAAAQASIIITGSQYYEPWGVLPQTPTYGQTFVTPDAVNTQLNSFSFFVQPGGNATGTFLAAVYQFSGSALNGPALFQSAVMPIPPATGGNSVQFTIATGGTQLTAGVKYVAFFLALSGTGLDTFQANDGNPYSAGEFVISNDASPTTLSSFPDSDLQSDFEFSAPNVTSTPEPASMALVAAGLAALGGMIRRRRRAGGSVSPS